jgi:hypothetical protein
MTSEARFLLNAIPIVLAFGILGGSCLFAWLKGKPAEQFGIAFYTVCFLLMVGFETFTGERLPTVPTLLLDTLIAFAFLLLAVIYNSLWLGFAMILQGVGLGLHAMHLTVTGAVQPGQIDVYALGNNLVSLGILVTFVAGTWISMRSRRKAQVRHSLQTGLSSGAA